MQVFTDGGSRGNPGPAAYGFVVKNGQEIIKEGFDTIGVATNNVAEYTAVIEALKFLSNSFKNQNLDFFIDSELVVSQLNGKFKIKNAAIRDLIVKVKELENIFKKITYTHIPREKNREADALVNLALDTIKNIND